jgi:hypothetical protein
MEPLNDEELNRLLMEWHAPAVPSIVPIPESRVSDWQWLWKGSFRIPVPVGLALLLILAWLSFFALHRPAMPEAQPMSRLSDFRPVKEVHIQVIRGDHEQN